MPFFAEFNTSRAFWAFNRGNLHISSRLDDEVAMSDFKLGFTHGRSNTGFIYMDIAEFWGRL